jgi:hypothetical protein
VAAQSRRYHFLIAVAMVVLLFACSVEAQTTIAPRCGTGVHEAESEDPAFFPQDQIFCPILADPKEARSFVSFLRQRMAIPGDSSHSWWSFMMARRHMGSSSRMTSPT